MVGATVGQWRMQEPWVGWLTVVPGWIPGQLARQRKMFSRGLVVKFYFSYLPYGVQSTRTSVHAPNVPNVPNVLCGWSDCGLW